jgi:hypothetical protein
MSGSILNYSQDLATQDAPPPLPTGVYPAEVTAVQKRTSNTSGREYLNVQMRIAPDSYPADYPDGDPEGTTLFYNRLLTADTPQARFQMKRFLQAVGASLSANVDLMDLIGLTCTVEITHQEYEGEMRSQISRIMPA